MDKKHAKLKRYLGIFFLAILCVGSIELLACRVADPDLFHRITSPICQKAGSLWHSGISSIQSTVEKIPALFENTDSEETPTKSETIINEDNSSPALTELIQQDETEILTGGSMSIVYYNQKEAPWAEQPYGKDKIGGYGCGPTVMSMVVSSMTEQVINPAEMADWAVQNGHWASRKGSKLSIVIGTANAFGLSAQTYRNFSPEALLQELAAGNLMVALMTKGHFTDGGHFILLRGATLDGNILVADPNSIERSLMTWDPNIILNELSSSESSGAPLWLLSPAAQNP